MKKLLFLFVFLFSVSTITAQSNYVIGLKNDTLRGQIQEMNEESLVFITASGATKSIPYIAISKAVKDGQDYPLRDGKFSTFPFIESEKAGFASVVEVEGLSAVELFKQIKEVVSSNSREFSRQASGSTVTFTYALLGVREASTQVVDMMYKNDSHLKHADEDAQKLIVRVVNRYEGGGFGCVRLVWWEYDLVIKCKDSRFRMELSNYRYNHYSNANVANKIQFYGIRDGGNCRSSGNIENLLLCEYCLSEFDKMFGYLVEDSHLLLNNLTSAVTKQVGRKEADW